MADSTTETLDEQSAPQPTVVWDGECGFCRRSVEYLQRRLPSGTAGFETYQQFEAGPEELTDDDYAEAVHLIRPDGTWSRGAEAIFEALALAPAGGWGHRLYHTVPGFGTSTERVYRWVANHRGLVDRVTRWVIGSSLGPRGFRFARRTFVRAIGLVFFLAFVSFGMQAAGLLGSEGVLPAAQRWDYLTGQPGNSFWTHPSVYWLVVPTDAVVWWTWVLGTAAAMVVMVGWIPIPALIVCWALYLSVVNVGGPFFSFQWDALLLESAWVAVLVSPWCWTLNGEAGDERVHRFALVVTWWLAFRLYLMSGLAKLLSWDPVWWNLTALEYHFWTQPLPTWTSYYAAGLPDVVLSGLTVGMFFIEICLPFFLFAPRRIRHSAAAGYAALQLGILATGNYGFFNVLTLALCIPMIDDGAWRYMLPSVVAPSGSETQIAPPGRWWRRCVTAACVVLVTLSGLKMGARLSLRMVDSRPIPQVVRLTLSVSGALDGFHSINNYGLFPNMTTERPEFIVEGSHDGEQWRRYDFRWKPDKPSDRPAYAFPHLPRLDWRLWFAALDGCPPAGWYRYLQVALLRGQSDVEALLAEVPFDEPPTYLRTTVENFQFAGRGPSQTVDDPAAWWQTTGAKTRCDTVTLRNGRLRTVRVQ